MTAEAVSVQTQDASALIEWLEARQVEVRVEQGELVVKAARGLLTPDKVASLKRHKQALLQWAEGLADAPPGATAAAAARITPEMVPLVRLDQAQIDRIVEATPGGVSNIQDIYPLAPLQEGILFHHLLQQEGDAYLTQSLMSFASKALLDQFALAMEQVIARHDVLRSAVHWDGLSEPVQVVWRRARLQIEELQFPHGDVQAQLCAHADPRRLRLDVRQAPLLRGFAAFDEAGQRWLLQLLYHHLVMDHISLELLVEEVALLLQGRDQQLPEPVPFRHFVAQARLGSSEAGSGGAEHQAFFRQMLGDLDQPTAPFELLEVQGSGANTVQAKLVLDTALAARLRRLARGREVSPASLFHLAWAQVLARCSGRDDLVFGTVLFGRLQGGPGADRAMGMFINTLPLRLRLAGQTVEQGLLQTHQALIELLRHEHAPLSLAQRCSGLPANTPLFSALLNYRYSPQEQPANGQVIAGIQHLESRDRTNYPFVLHVDDRGQGFSLTAEIVDSLSAERIASFVLQALEALVDALEQAPRTPLQALEVLPLGEREQLLAGLGSGARQPRAGTLVHRQFERQVARTPEAVALEFEHQRISYRTLNEQANQLAHHLRGLGVGPDQRVAVFLERGPGLVLALLATLKAGGAYVPLDPAHPRERLAQMLEDCQPLALLSQPRLAERLAPPAGCVGLLLDQLPWEQGPWAGQPRDDLETEALGLDPDHLAYVIYTSGSTGVPKGVGMPHRALVNLLAWQQQVLPEPARTLQFAAPGFDVAFQEIFSTLVAGGTLVLVDETQRQDLSNLADWIGRHAIERLFLPYIALHTLSELWAQQGTALSALRDLITAGEQLRITPAIRRLFEQTAARLHNHYGPTESHVVCAHTLSGPAADWEDLPPIGRPIDNCRIHLLDAQRQLVPLGVAGELCIGGTAVARGYLQRPELTAERFGEDPFFAGEPLYRTGDLARWRADGTLEYLGRNDFQLKVRGYRIEPGEVEAQLLRLPGLREVAVVAREDVPGEPRLVAYVVVDEGGEAPDPAVVRAQLSQVLPAYMLPAAFVALAALPLTPNGKLDRQALPAPEGQAFSHRGYEATIGDIETTLARIWSSLLGVEQVGRQDNFFELGGHSLLAMRLISQLRQQLGIELPLAALFTHPQLADLAQDVAEAGQHQLTAILRADRSVPLPLSFAQQRLWFIARVDPEASKAYHIPDAVRLSGPLDRSALKAALDRIVERHEVLRTRFVGIGGVPRQVIDAPRGFALRQRDLPGASDAELARICAEEAAAPFDLARGPLIRGQLLCLGEEDHVLLVTMHHIISDGWSQALLTREFATLYPALRDGQGDPLPALAIQYADYAAWQRQWLQGPLLQQQLQQAVERLRGAPSLLDLPTDRPRPVLQDYRGANLAVDLGVELSQGLRALSQRHGCTLYMTLLAAWSAVLARLSGQQQVVIGSSYAGRNRVEVEPLIGFFVNTQALKLDLGAGPNVKALLAQAREVALQAQRLQDVPFERLVEALNPPRSLAHQPLFQVMLSWHNTPKGSLQLPGLQAQRLGDEPDSAQFELSLELREEGESIVGQLNYATALFNPATLARHLGYLRAMLQAMVEDDSQPVARIALLDARERELLLQGFNDSPAALLQDPLLHTRFERQAAAQPETLALVHAGQSLSYAALNARANQLAHHLRALGVGPDQRVAICAERGLDLPVALLATLKAGGAYVPLDPVYPDARLQQMLRDSGARVLLTQRALGPRLHPAPDCARLLLDDASSTQGAWGGQPTDNPTPAAVGLQPSHLAYVIYTSGSTGTPKGVMVEHRQVLNFLEGLELHVHGLQPDCRRIAWNSSFGFDMAVKAWGQLLQGRTLYLVPDATRLSAQALLAFLEEQRIEALECTPSHWRLLQDAGLLDGRAPALRKVLLGGEALDGATWNSLAADDSRLFFNMYGPTECSVDASCALIDGRLPHAGRVMPGARIYLLDAERQPVPLGAVGEIHIGGAGVARGYLDREALTAERFLADPFVATPGARLYRTGDLGRWRADGNLEVLGRNDFQVKLRGFRIELGEIEAQLLLQPGVREAVVIAREDQAGEPRLVAYVVAQAALESLDPAALRAGLAERLPEHMLPVAFVTLPALPLTANGKLDRRALPAPEGQGLALQRYEAPEGAREQVVAALWSQLLGVERIGRHDNFFDLGGYSLMLFQVIEGLKEHGYEVALQDVLQAQKLSALAQVLSRAEEALAAHPQWLVLRKGGARRPLIFIHEPSGEVLSYERLTRVLDPEIGVYGIRADRHGVGADSTHEALAEHYVQLIRQALPDGPYRLAGWSAGGALAYEVARQLIGQGQSVEFLGLIDSWHHGEHDRGVSALGLDDKKLLLVALIEYYGYKLQEEQIAHLMQAPDLPAAVERARSAGWLTKELSGEEVEARAQLWFDLRAAAHRYHAQPVDVPAHLFSALPAEPADPSNGWGALLGRRLTVHPVGGDHWSIMMDPRWATRVGHLIDATLARIDAATPPPDAPLHPSAVLIRSGGAGASRVFCIPGAGANATSLLPLCSGFAGPTRFIALEAAGLLDPSAAVHSVQDTAGAYVRAIQSMQPQGPYHLLGHSFGGWIALEVARQLFEQGAAVAPVVLLDTQAPREQGHGGRSEALGEYLKLMELTAGASLGLDLEALAALDESAQCQRLFERMKQAGVLPASARLRDIAPVIELFCRQCAMGYPAEQPFAGLPLLLRATSRADGDDDLQRWRRREPGVRVVEVEGSDHLSILQAPHVERLVEVIGQHWYLAP
ncbi:MAG: amino acid adenylation domain-containing protein [Pseudomonas sp.]|uniref:amino acid adenylation domain-containing protein n=1 Tax=Pseudomonas sp. TaxID=306 RepID=UPI00339AB166